MVDRYERLGEFHDLFMEPVWAALAPALADAFGALGPGAVVADLGAGTGVGTRVLARSTAAEIVAVEPSLTMRAVLTARIADDPDLAARVSVLAGGVPDVLAEVPPLDGFVCAHVLGHLTAAVRARTFARLAGVLKPTAVGVVVVNPEPGDARPEPVLERRLGRYRYVVAHVPAGDGRYASEYQVIADDGMVARRERFAGRWATITLGDLAAELAPASLAVTRRAPGVGLIRRS